MTHISTYEQDKRSNEEAMRANLRRCHGYPGHTCTNMTTDYRCQDCWHHMRGWRDIAECDVEYAVEVSI